MAGGSPAPVNREDAASHVNPTYDSDEDGVIELARNAEQLDSRDPSAFETPASTGVNTVTYGYGGTQPEFTSPQTEYQADGYAQISGLNTFCDGIRYSVGSNSDNTYEACQYSTDGGSSWTTIASPYDTPDGRMYTHTFNPVLVTDLRFRVYFGYSGSTRRATVRDLQLHIPVGAPHDHPI